MKLKLVKITFLSGPLEFTLPIFHCVCHRAVIGEVDEELDSEINLAEIRAEPLNTVVH